jgi:hypothetical protein
MNQEFKPCRYCGRQGSDMHHLLKRSTNPELIDDPKNLVLLCRPCHVKTENDSSFLKALQDIFYHWKPANLDLYLRAQASIDVLLEGREVEYLTPGMTDSYLTLAGASYNYYSEQLAELEKLRPAFYIARKKEAESDEKSLSDKYIEMEWQTTSNGQKMIDYNRKLKALEKTQSNLKAKLRRMEIERFNSK